MGKENQDCGCYNEFADALLAQSLQGCKEPDKGMVEKPLKTNCCVNLTAVALEQENYD